MALNKARAASNDALVHKALHPLRILKRQSHGHNRASSAAANPADHSRTSPLVPRQRQPAWGNSSPAPTSGGNAGKSRRGKKPFHHTSNRSGNAKGNNRGPRKCQTLPGRDAGRSAEMPVTALETVAGNNADHWMVSVLKDGYHIPFLHQLAPLVGSPVSFPTYPPGFPKALALRQEVKTMIAKGALETVPNLGLGFYSRLFLVEKASGGWRPVIELSPLNEFVQQTPFKIEIASSVLLKDAYFQIPVHTSARKWLRFVADGVTHQFKVPCFGLSTAPQVFTKVFATVSAWAHSRGICLLRYLDDWPRPKLEPDHVRDLSLGIVLNKEKSDLNPSQSMEYLSMTLDTVAARAYPTTPRIDKEVHVALEPPAQLWQVLLGHMSSLEKLVPRG